MTRTWEESDRAVVDRHDTWSQFVTELAQHLGRDQLTVGPTDTLDSQLDDFELFAVELRLRQIRLVATPTELELHAATFADLRYWLTPT